MTWILTPGSPAVAGSPTCSPRWRPLHLPGPAPLPYAAFLAPCGGRRDRACRAAPAPPGAQYGARLGGALMTPVRPWSLAAVAVCCAALAWLVIRFAYSSFPPLPWSGAPSLLLLAAAEAWSGRNLRARIRGRPGSKPVVAIAVARMAVLAKASATVAAIFGGLAAGFLIYLGGLVDKPAPRSDAITAGGTLAAAAVLAAAALYLERCCRAPDPPDDAGA
jgi:hypothetical protein